jgi:uncharacterized protein DUF2690
MNSVRRKTPQEGRKPSVRRQRLLRSLVCVLAGLGFALLSVGTASAANLPHDGTDPITTGCANTAVTVNNTAVDHGGVYYGNLALRWSTDCKTNWAKFTGSGSVGSVAVWVYRQADKKSCGDQSGTGCNGAWWPNSAYSNQLYGCNYNTLAQVEVFNNGNPFWVDTPYVGGC